MPETDNEVHLEARPALREMRANPEEQARLQASGRSKRTWRIVSGLTLLFVVGGLLYLWPILKMAGTGVAVLMAAAVLATSLTPLLLLRRILRSPSEKHGRPGGTDA